MPYRYFYLNRPPAYAHQPDGYTAQEGGLPARRWETTEGHPVYAFGWVEYEQPLTSQQVWKWDFRPDDATEDAHYYFWHEAERDEEAAASLEQDYISQFRRYPDQFRRYESQEMVARVQLLVDEQDRITRRIEQTRGEE